jgi:hypothetical protein
MEVASSRAAVDCGVVDGAPAFGSAFSASLFAPEAISEASMWSLLVER